MNENRPPEGNIGEEFRRLGKNLAETFRAALESPESKRLQQEIANGLSDLGRTLETEANKFKESPKGQQFKAEVEDFKQRVKAGEVENKVREDLLSALRTANEQLSKVADRWADPNRRPGGGSPVYPQGRNPGAAEGGGTDRSAPDPQSDAHQEVGPDDQSSGPANVGHREVNPDDLD